MIKIKVIESEMTEIIERGKKLEDQREKNRLTARYNFLKVCKNYLLTNPTQEFCQHEKERLGNLIVSLNNRLQEELAYLNDDRYKNVKEEKIKEITSHFNSKYKISDIRKKLATINFLLNQN